MNDASDLETFDPEGELPREPTLLEASAGTGKTYTISSMVLRLVAERHLTLPEILVVTFTRAATSELRDRVRRRLVHALRSVEGALADPGFTPDPDRDAIVAQIVGEGRERGGDELRARLDALATAREDFDDATISTIHGFCHETLRHSAFESRLDYAAELLEDVGDLLEEITHDFLASTFRDADPGWYRYVHDRGVKRDTLLDLARSIENEPHLRLLPEDSTDDPQQRWLDAIARIRERWRTDSPALVAWLNEICDRGEVTSTYTVEKIATHREPLDAWCEAEQPDLDDLKTIREHVAYFSRGSIEEKLRRARIPADLPLVDACEEFIDELDGAVTAVKRQFAGYVRRELDARKRQRNVLSYTDLLHRLSDALADDSLRDALRAAIRQRHRAALIDEFQDTDPVQWHIFQTVFADDWLYLVGDPKQAIYAFRGADVHEYLEVAATVDDARHTLDTNWRSDQRLVDALNHLLDRDVVFGHPDIRYIEVEAADEHACDRLTLPGDDPHAPLMIRHFPRALAGKDGTSAVTKGWARPAIARELAVEITALLDSGATIHPDGEEPRPVGERDLAVLVRTNDEARRVQEQLLAAGVQAVIGGGGNVYESDEAVHLQRVLDGLLRPHSERQVKAAITTPLFGVTALDLAEMEQDEHRWEDWVDALSRWAQRWRDDGVIEALRTAFADRGVHPRVLGLPDGERRMTNILHLLELLHTAESEHRLGPTGLAAWLRMQRSDAEQTNETEIRLESDDEAVTVMTIHRSKGLEFPLVWCPFLWDGDLLKGGTDNLRLHHPTDGELVLDLHVDAKAEPKATHKRYAQWEDWQENLRLLYVALTRARHRVVVYWGAFNSAANSPLAHVLHDMGIRSGDDGHPHRPSGSLKLTDEKIRSDLHELAAGSGGTIAIEEATAPDAVEPRGDTPPAVPELTARTFSRSGVDRTWQRSSFTALTRPLDRDEPHEGSPAAEGEDRADDPTEIVVDGEDRATAAEVPLSDFPRGPDAGTLLHGILEDLDFTQADTPGVLEDVAAARFARHRVTDATPADLVGGLRLALATPLGEVVEGRPLTSFAPGDCLRELWFDLPVAGGYTPTGSDATVSLSRIRDVLGDSAATSPIARRYADHLDEQLPARQTRGFMTGAIDLVVRHRPDDGPPRFLVVDHKSNWLGERRPDGESSTAAHYHPDRLADAMVEHHYVLQYHLYLVALHRFLRWRLGDDYDYDRHVGGALYLFLRGMTGADVARTDDDQPYGVYADRPPALLIEALDGLLADPGEA